MKNFWKKFGWVCLTILPTLISLIAQIGMGVIMLFIISFMNAAEVTTMSSDPLALTEYLLAEYAKSAGVGIFCYHIVALIGFGIWYYFGCGKPKMTNPVKTFKGKCLPATVILALGLCFFANAFVLVGQFVAPAAIESYMELMEAAGLGVDTFSILASIILAPIGEEILCRGLTYHYAKKVVAGMNNRTVAFWIANTLQALMFGIMHANLIQGLYAFILGLGLGWLRERYNSLYPAMLAHFVINFSSTYIVGYPISLLPETLVSYLILMVVSIAVTAVGIYLTKAPKDEVKAAA